MNLRVGSLFSGIGGIELGLERAGGFETCWFIENDKHAQAILRKHWPKASIYDDITTTDFNDVPPIDVLTGGFPCQDISNAGKRAGITGSRSSLWKHYFRAISVLRPKLVLAENVAALTQRGLDTVLCDLATLGYDAEWHCIPASAVGAPHRRDRIIIIAYSAEQRLHTKKDEQELEGEGSGKLQFGESRNTQQSNTNVAYSDDCGQLYRQAYEHSDQRRELSFGNIRESNTDVAYSISDAKGSAYRKECGNNIRRWNEPNIIKWDKMGCFSSNCGGQWAVEPDVGRVAHGVPHRVDRIKRLGNAVVPQWAQAIGQAIKEEGSVMR